MSEEKATVEVVEEKKDKKAEKAAAKEAKKAKKQEAIKEAKADEKPHRILNFLSKEYKGENAVMLFLALFAIVLGVLIVTGTLEIAEEYFLVGLYKGKLFAWILIGLAGISLLFVIIPFYRPSMTEIKHLKTPTKAEFLVNVARTMIFIVLMAAFFFLCDLGLNPLMELIKK